MPPIAIPIEPHESAVNEESTPAPFPYSNGIALKEPDKALWSDSDLFQFCSSETVSSSEWPSTSPKPYLQSMTHSFDDLTQYMSNNDGSMSVGLIPSNSGTSSSSSHMASTAFYTSQILNDKVSTMEKDGRRFACSVYGCARRFKRLEHLKRHGRTHTGERPFNCPIVRCGKKFSRSDNLVQHLRIHINNKDDAVEAEKFLQRVRKISRNHQPNSENFSLSRIPYDMMLVNPVGEGSLPQFKETQSNIFPPGGGMQDIYLETVRPSETNPFLMQVAEQTFSQPPNALNGSNNG